MISTPSLETQTPPDTAQEQALDIALAQVLSAPLLPRGFREQLLAAAWRDNLQRVEARRQVLEREHALAMENIRKNHVILQRDTLAMILGIAFTAGACVHLALPWLQQTWGIDATVAGPVLALVIGLAAGASVWADQLGRPDALPGVGEG